MVFSRICRCRICATEELTNQALLPVGWAILWDISITICDKCLDNWEKRFGSRPILYMEGGVEEPTLFDDTI